MAKQGKLILIIFGVVLVVFVAIAVALRFM